MHPAMALQLSCSALGVGGRGVCRAVVNQPALVYFIAGALPGELVEARVTSVHARYAEAELLSVSRASPDRVTPTCALAGTCGGCTLMNLSYTAQLAAKGQLVADALGRVGAFEHAAPLSPLASPRTLRYRNKMEFTVAPGAPGAPPLVGLQRAGSTELVDVPSCPLQSEVADAVLASLRSYLAAHASELPAFDAATGGGLVRRLMLRTSAAGMQVDVLVTGEGHDAALGRLAAHLVALHPAVVSVVSTQLAPPPSPPAAGGRRRAAPPPPPSREATRALHGAATLPMSLGGVSFDVSSRSFFQVNPMQAEQLLAIVRTAAGLTANTRASVLDLFCGTGALSLPLLAACPGATLLGVDVSPSAVADAGAAARSSGLAARARFKVANLTDRKALAQKWLLQGENGKGWDVLLVDPARAGLAPPMVAFLRAATARRLVYVSCDPGTLARDLRALCAAPGVDGAEGEAWTLDSTGVQPVDMFPQSMHCEAVASLRRI